MTIQTSFFDWAHSGIDWNAPPYEAMAPNLVALNNWLVTNFGGQNLGLDDFDREIRSGGTISDHAYGAAIDWRYEPSWLPNTSPRTLPRAEALKLADHIIDWSAEMGIQRIHDYVGDRIWTAGRTSNIADAHGAWWKPQNGAGSGMGESWARYFHFATTKGAFANSTPIVLRGVPLPGQAWEPIPVPPSVPLTTYTVKSGDTLTSIAKAYDTTVTGLLKLNPQITDPNKIYVGQKINVPAGSTTPTPTPPPPPAEPLAANGLTAAQNAADGAIAATPPGDPIIKNTTVHTNAPWLQQVLCAIPKLPSDGGGPIYPPLWVGEGRIGDGPAVFRMFGDGGKSALAYWQSKNGLVADGVYGPQTEARLRSVRGR